MKTFFTILLTFFLQNLSSQIIDGEASIYNKGCYDMATAEGWKRLEVNGNMDFNRKGYLSFKSDQIVLVIGSSTLGEEIYKRLEFKSQERNLRRTLLFGNIMHDSFLMVDKDKNTVVINYIKGKYFENGKGVFVISDYKNKTMYFLTPFKDETLIMETLYN